MITRAERRRRRALKIRKRMMLNNWRQSWEWDPDNPKPGIFSKHYTPWYQRHRSRQKRKSYIVPGFLKYGYWDDPYHFNVRQRLKQELAKAK